MAIRNIRVMGDDILRKKSKPVKEVTERIRTMIDDMYETMYETMGVGLAAPQIGILKRIVVIDIGDGNQITLINPVIVEKDGEQIGDEGCLSIPNKVGTVKRPNHVVCEALNEEMEPIRVEGEGFLARAICHECEHLDGHLYVEKVEGELHDTPDMEEIEE